MWPEDERAVKKWAQTTFAELKEEPTKYAKQERSDQERKHHQSPKHIASGGDEDSGGLELRSITPSLHNEQVERQRTPESHHHIAPPVSVRNDERHQDKREDELQNADDLVAEALFKHAEAAVPELPFNGEGDELQVEQLAKETEGLRAELERAKEKQSKALKESEELRKELSAAKELQKKVQSEVKQLQDRRKEIIATRTRQGAGNADNAGPGPTVAKGKGRGREAPAAPASDVAKEQAEELLKAFDEPLKILFGQYAKSRRGPSGKQLELKVEVLESMLGDLGIIPSRMQKRAVPQLLRAVQPKKSEEVILVDAFMALLLRMAPVSFADSEAAPYQDFGISVPVDGTPTLKLQLQAMLQQIESLAETSHLSSLRVTRSAFAKAKRLWVLTHTRATLTTLNSRLLAGEEQDSIVLPEGFEIAVRKPPKLFLVPAGLPIADSERIAVELLDEILALAVGVHFLEDASTGGPRPTAFVKGHEDLSELEPKEVPKEPEAVRASQRPTATRTQNQKEPVRPRPVVQDEDLTQPKRPPRSEAQAPGRQPLAGGAQRAASQEPPQRQRQAAPKQPPRRNQPQPSELPAESEVPEQPRARPQKKQSQESAAASGEEPPARKVENSRTRPAAKEASKSPSPHREASQRPRQPRGQSASPERPAAPPVEVDDNDVQAADLSPAALEQQRRQKNLQKYKANAEEGKLRREALQGALRSATVVKLLKASEPNIRRVFEFFQRWKGTPSGDMTLAGFILLGECFGVLNKDSLKVVFKKASGSDMSPAKFPHVLMESAARVVEEEAEDLETKPDGVGPSADVAILTQAFSELCRHMLLSNTKALGKCLDNYRRVGDRLPQFVFELPEPYASQPKKNAEEAAEPSNAVAPLQSAGQGKLAKYKANAEEGKQRQDALNSALRSSAVVKLLKASEPNLRRVFEFFTRWKGDARGERMTLAGFLLLCECFGLLSKESTKAEDARRFTFRKGAGYDMGPEEFPDVLMQCAARTIEEEVEALDASFEGGGPLADVEVLAQAFQALCRHMLLNNPKALHKCMDDYRREGSRLPEFVFHLPEPYASQAGKRTMDSTALPEQKGSAEAAAEKEVATAKGTGEASVEAPETQKVEGAEDAKVAEEAGEAAAEAKDGAEEEKAAKDGAGEEAAEAGKDGTAEEALKDASPAEAAKDGAAEEAAKDVAGEEAAKDAGADEAAKDAAGEEAAKDAGAAEEAAKDAGAEEAAAEGGVEVKEDKDKEPKAE